MDITRFLPSPMALLPVLLFGSVSYLLFCIDPNGKGFLPKLHNFIFNQGAGFVSYIFLLAKMIKFSQKVDEEILLWMDYRLRLKFGALYVPYESSTGDDILFGYRYWWVSVLLLVWTKSLLRRHNPLILSLVFGHLHSPFCLLDLLHGLHNRSWKDYQGK